MNDFPHSSSPSTVEYTVSAEEYLARLERLRDDYSNAVPIKMVTGKVTHQKATHKVQHNWWQMLILNLGYLAEDVQLPEEIGQEVEEFIAEYTSQEFKRKIRTTIDDIEKANQIIQRCIDALMNLKVL